MKTLFILNDAPYGSERSYNGLRLAGSLVGRKDEEVKLFLIGDAASCAKSDQKLPSGFYNIEVMLRNFFKKGGEIGICGTCLDARGLTDASYVEGSKRSTMEELTNWTQWADKVLVF